jgi:hypothetical protein
VRKVIRQRIRRREDGLDLAVDLNADIAVNVGRSQRGTKPDASSDERLPEDSTTSEDEPDEREDP